MTIGDKIAAARKKQNLTQDGLAELLEVTRQTVSRWESGLAYPEMDKVVKLCETLEINCDYLLKSDVTESGVKIIERVVTEKNEPVQPADIIRIIFGFISLLGGISITIGGFVLLISSLRDDGLFMFMGGAGSILLGILLTIMGWALLKSYKNESDQKKLKRKETKKDES